MFYGAVKWVVGALLRVLFRLRAVGGPHVPREGAVLLAANHVSLLDPPIVGVACPRQLHFMAKAELFGIPLLSRLIGSLNAHPVDRSGADAGALRRALRQLRAGRALLVFPEGTRGAAGGGLRPGKPGVGMLAVLADAPVIPVYIQGSARVLPRGAVRPRLARITVAFGPALRFGAGRGREHYQQVTDEIMAAIGRLKAAVEGPVDAQPVGPAPPDHTDRTGRGPLPAGRIH